MKILLVGASGTIGSNIYDRLQIDHEIIRAGRNGADVQVDITDESSIRDMYERIGNVDAVINASGSAGFASLTELTPDKNETAINSKLKGQMNLVLLGIPYINDGGSFTLTSGVMMDDPIPKGSSAAMANGAIRSFVTSAAVEMPRDIRINSVSPGLLEESASRIGHFFRGFIPVPGKKVAVAYQKSVEGAQTGQSYEVYE
ncbi:NAD(P)-dependent dehydrogenase (short-subunit alcohol dehydrogenase family) [Geomicrobium halophilum]|uniref:NAD(P)-dependent dehydrogenase (Short-subunit alcohol dehydrogenase family) n=1 Tax=Geomicrobium halophilum TaxID=549000 RepID=A0A841PWZ1_9BACL|nr:short chain dehydrogenase [Geomicrobium halophilum]MBB6451091.1 NAD(P)-dependent dehydrogenase (short-subunit alcohol dehydrogenase family) [Geomicrobium halophilum]